MHSKNLGMLFMTSSRQIDVVLVASERFPCIQNVMRPSFMIWWTGYGENRILLLPKILLVRDSSLEIWGWTTENIRWRSAVYVGLLVSRRREKLANWYTPHAWCSNTAVFAVALGNPPAPWETLIGHGESSSLIGHLAKRKLHLSRIYAKGH